MIESQPEKFGRLGHLAFCDGKTGKIIVFGGQMYADFQNKFKRLITNSISIFDPEQQRISEIKHLMENQVAPRMYSCGFLIDQRLYVIGGLSLNGKVLGDFKEIDLTLEVGRSAQVECGLDLLEQVYCSQMCPVFYQSRCFRNLQTRCEEVRSKDLVQKLNWGNQTQYIMQEGFYMFGGRLQNNFATNKLLLF